MKTTRLPGTLLLAALAALTTARADLTITQEFEQSGAKPVEMTMKMKDGKIRSDINEQMTAIIDVRTGDTTTLMHGQKMAMKIPGMAVKAAQARVASEMGAEDVAAPEKTGRVETISGFRCEEYVTTHDGKKITIWITDDIPDADQIMQQFAALSPDANPAGNLFDASKVEGFPIRTVAGMGDGKTITMTVTGLSRDLLPSTDFEVPSGYREMAMPQIPGQ
jgi:hypothetical protein